MSRTSVLIVEDELIIAENLAGKLRQLGYAVAGIATRGREALDMALANRPQLILMDINLHNEYDGIRAAEAIRERHDVPVIYLTAHSDPATLHRAKITGPFGYILKPFEERDLATQIELALYKHQAERQVHAQREWFRGTLASIGDAVIAADAEGLITFINPVAEALTGWSIAEAIGKPLGTVFHIVDETTRAPLEDPVSKVLQSREIVGLTNHTVLLRRGGTDIPIDESGAPIRDREGRIQGVVLVFRDVTERKKMERALRDSEEKFRSLFEHSHVAVFFTTPEGGIEAANPAASAIFGYTEQEFRGIGRSGIFDTGEPRFSDTLIQRQLEGHIKAVELTAIRKGGAKFPVEVDSVPLSVEPLRSFLILRDITARKQAEEALRESEARLAAILNQLPVGVGVFDSSGRLVLRNDVMQHYVPGMIPSRDPERRRRWHAADSAGHPLPPDQWPGARALRGESVVPGREFSFTDDRGRELWMMVSAVPFQNSAGNTYAGILVVQDITPTKRAERALLETNEELSEYTYAVVHNVKAPFRAVQNYANFLIEDLGASLKGEPKQFLEGIQSALRQANLQFRDLDALYQIRTYAPEFEPLDMKALLDEIAAVHRPAPDRQLEFPDRWPVVMGEPFLLRQIMAELIHNGFKYNRSAVKRVAVGWRQTAGHHLEISVRDNGIGVDPKYHDHIFHIFKRLHTEQEYEGTGIGLAIVRRAVKKIGGQLRIESAAGEGSTFLMRLPDRRIEGDIGGST